MELNRRYVSTLVDIFSTLDYHLLANSTFSLFSSKMVHEDITWGTPLRFARNYVPHYSLFIPLQNTTAQMGASGVCPGSHMCSAGNLFFCHERSFQVFEQYDHWPVGWGFLYNQQLTHNGEAHTDPDAPERVQLIMTFTPRPRYGEKELETRFLAEGGADFVSIAMRMQHVQSFQSELTLISN